VSEINQICPRNKFSQNKIMVCRCVDKVNVEEIQFEVIYMNFSRVGSGVSHLLEGLATLVLARLDH
jgi:predicted ATPase